MRWGASRCSSPGTASANPKRRYKSAELEAQIEAYERAYRAFRYTDEQREQAIRFVEQAMNVLRGDAPLESLSRLFAPFEPEPKSVDGEATRGGMKYEFDLRPWNDWARAYVLGTTDVTHPGEVEPYHLSITFSPSMSIERERLETLLALKVLPGWTTDGGNLRPPVFDLHTGRPDNGGDFEYAPLQQPTGPYNIEVKLGYLLGEDRNPFRTRKLVTLKITRRYLTPEQVKQRDAQRVGHLPYSGDICTAAGKYVPVLPHDPDNRLDRRPWETSAFDVGDRFPMFGFMSTHTEESERIPVWWRWVAPDPWLQKYGKQAGNGSPT